MEYYVHYSVLDPKSATDPELGICVKRLVTGPYTMDEAFTKRRELEADGGSLNVYINERNTA